LRRTEIRLHYDLRLEQNGVLKSWAIPKGLPPRPGIKRLAVNVEDHPLAYLQFEGRIPRGEYGAGMMWKFARGRFQITKQKKDGMYFELHSPEWNGEFRMHCTKDNQWLLERVDTPQTDWLRDPIKRGKPLRLGSSAILWEKATGHRPWVRCTWPRMLVTVWTMWERWARDLTIARSRRYGPNCRN
jgi:DNA ligase D-like protein (predicted 3'-phosphoesterase)